MKILLAAINAKYIHSNPAIHSLKAAAEAAMASAGVGKRDINIELGEYTINHTTEAVRADIWRRRPDMLCFSCYIWNIAYVRTLVRDLHTLMPEMQIWLGGPEVSYDAPRVLQDLREVKGVMVGPGEASFARLALLQDGDDACRSEIPGLVFRDVAGEIRSTGMPKVMALNEIPFWYEDLTEFENRIIYYESSRGCPFACSYCLSSIDKTMDFRDPERVKRELQFFLDRKVPQVKFIDRTFNCRENHALAIWEYIAEHDNGVTNFHFEIAADLLTEAELTILAGMRPGLVQLEIGVQSTNPETVREIRRVMDLKKVAERVARVNSFRNIHQHLDLIAGLPYEDYDSFGRSFDDVYAMEPEQLQLGFLKVLKGAHMQEMVEKYDLQYTSEAPYEVMSTRWLPYGDVLRLKGVEAMVEIYYNSGQFNRTLRELVKAMGRPFVLYEQLAEFWIREGLDAVQSNRSRKYEILLRFAEFADPGREGIYRKLLTDDCYRRENMKNRPSFAPEQRVEDWQLWKDFLQRESKEHHFLAGYEGIGYREMMNLLHGEVYVGESGDAELVVYDYRHRDPLTNNAGVTSVMREAAEEYARKGLPPQRK